MHARKVNACAAILDLVIGEEGKVPGAAEAQRGASTGHRLRRLPREVETGVKHEKTD